MVAKDGSVENNAGNIPGTNVNSTLAPSGPVTMIQYENDKFDFGTVDEGEVVKHVFKFKNAGTKCRDHQCQRFLRFGPAPNGRLQEPIAPGAFGEIKVEFNSKGKPGRQKQKSYGHCEYHSHRNIY